jgi:TRAP-type C4-dicarboxylate transport system substrate-binding protein
MAEALDWGNTIAQYENDEALANLRLGGGTRIHAPDEAQRQRLRQATQEVALGLQGRIGRQWMDRVRAVLGG